MTVSVSGFIQSKAIYLLVAGAALGANWWLDAVNREAAGPAVEQHPSVAVVSEARETRLAKDDLLSIQPQPAYQERTLPAAVASKQVPIPTIIRTSSEVASQPTHKRAEPAAVVQTCLPACNSHDPLVMAARPVSIAVPANDFDVRDIEVAPRPTIVASILGRGEILLANAGAASAGAYRGGRWALRVITDPMR